MDPFEEFEFKPLTEGLGFHKKKQSPPSKADDFDSFTSPIKDSGLKMIEESVDPLRSPLPRKKEMLTEIPVLPNTPAPAENSTAAAVDEILKTLQKNRRLDMEAAAASASTVSNLKKPQEDVYKKTNISFSAAFLDMMLIVAANLLCLIILLAVTKADIINSLTRPNGDYSLHIATASMAAAIIFIYLSVNRAFAGCTPGEWAYDQRLGKPQDQGTAGFSLRVIFRSLLIVGTGIITLPLLSFILRMDIAGQLSGAYLYKKV